MKEQVYLILKVNQVRSDWDKVTFALTTFISFRLSDLCYKDPPVPDVTSSA